MNRIAVVLCRRCRERSVGLLFAGVVVNGSWGCSNDDSAPGFNGPSPQAVPSDPSDPSPPSDGGHRDGPPGECNTLVNDAPHVVPRDQPTAPPAPLGGMVTDGKYELTTYNLFIGPDGQEILLGDFWAANVFMVSGTTIQSIEGYRMEGLDHLPGTARTYSFTTSGTTLSIAETCPMPTDAASIEFTATASELRWYEPSPGAMAELTYTKQ